MEYDEVKDAALGMDLEDQRRLQRELTEHIARELKRKADLCEAVIAAAELAVGYDRDTETRKVAGVTVRMLAAQRLRELHVPQMTIARAMGRNHSSVYHYWKTMDDIFQMPRAYRDTINKYNLLKDLTHDL